MIKFVNLNQRHKLIRFDKMKTGDTGFMDYNGTRHLVLKTFLGLVSLTDPSHTWDTVAASYHNIELCDIEIKILD